MRKKDRVEVVEQHEDGWWLCRAPNGDEGLVPMNFLQLQHTELAAAESIRCRVMHSFNAENDGDLSLAKGDLVTVTHRDDSGWWTGVDAAGNEGVFPMNFVRVEEPGSKAAAGDGRDRSDSETSEAESTDSAEAGPPVPDGWAAVASQSRPGQKSYVNVRAKNKRPIFPRLFAIAG